MAEALRFSLGRCGLHALRTLRAGTPLRLAAVFEHSFYLQAGSGFACLGGPRLELGPLNGRLDAPAGMNWLASGLRTGARCARSPAAIHIGGRFLISLAAVRPWRPEAAPDHPELPAVAAVLERVEAAAGRNTALGTLPGGRAAMADAGRWLGAALGNDDPGDTGRWVAGLIGLGPGLTPSGDDFLGGILIALHAIGRSDLAADIAGTALPAAAATGNAISVAHLAAAAEGQGSAPLHRLLVWLLRGNGGRIDARMAAVGRIGHTSGWDGLAGVAAALRAWLAAEAVRRRAA